MKSFKIEEDQIPENLFWLYELVGMEHFLQIIDTAGGEMLYLPKRATLERELRHRAIVREFTGRNQRQLARKYGLSERHVRSILQQPEEETPRAKSS